MKFISRLSISLKFKQQLPKFNCKRFGQSSDTLHVKKTLQISVIRFENSGIGAVTKPENLTYYTVNQFERLAKVILRIRAYNNYTGMRF